MMRQGNVAMAIVGSGFVDIGWEFATFRHSLGKCRPQDGQVRVASLSLGRYVVLVLDFCRAQFTFSLPLSLILFSLLFDISLPYSLYLCTSITGLKHNTLDLCVTARIVDSLNSQDAYTSSLPHARRHRGVCSLYALPLRWL